MKHAHLLLPTIGLSLALGCGRNPAEKPAPPPPAPVQPAESPPQAKAVEPLPTPTTKNLADAVSAGNVKDVKIFLQRDPQSIHQTGKNDMLPIHLAADTGNSEIIQLLLHAGADVNAPHEKVQATPLQYAAESGHLDAVRTFAGCQRQSGRRGQSGAHPAHVGGHEGTCPRD